MFFFYQLAFEVVAFGDLWGPSGDWPQEVIAFGDRPQEVIGFGDLWGPSGTSGDHLGTSGDHLGNRFDEVIGFITDPDLPECAGRSVTSSEYRWSEN